jgi:hypothetical protein
MIKVDCCFRYYLKVGGSVASATLAELVSLRRNQLVNLFNFLFNVF